MAAGAYRGKSGSSVVIVGTVGKGRMNLGIDVGKKNLGLTSRVSLLGRNGK